MKTAGILAFILAILTLSVAIVGSTLPRMHRISRTIQLKNAPDAVWKVLNEYYDYPTWRSDVQRIERIPASAGVEGWREVNRLGAVTIHVVDSQAPHRLVAEVAETNLPFSGTWSYEIQPADGGTKVTITENGTTNNPFARFVSRFVLGLTAGVDEYLKDLGKKMGEEVKPAST